MCTSFVTSYTFLYFRLTTIRNADVIVALKGGIVEEKGTHDELMELQGLYFELVQSQLAGKNDDEEEENDEVGPLEYDKPTNKKMSRQMSRQMSQLDAKARGLSLTGNEDDLVTDRSKLMRRLMQLSKTETHYILIGSLH